MNAMLKYQGFNIRLNDIGVSLRKLLNVAFCGQRNGQRGQRMALRAFRDVHVSPDVASLLKPISQVVHYVNPYEHATTYTAGLIHTGLVTFLLRNGT